MKKAFCVGINDYPGTSNDLKGCVNDATDWAAILEYSGFEVEKITNSQATRQKILSTLDSLVTNAVAGDEIVFTYSGHGTSVYDVDGDEPDEYDEALYVYDGLLLDDELRAIFQKVKPGVHVAVISDSCFSGTVTRALITDNSKPRYIKTHDIPPTAKLKRRLLVEEDMIEILLSGCSNSEYSYDAYLDGRWNGALTSYATSVIRKGQTYKEFYQKVRDLLPSGQYPQTPQLEGSEANKNRVVFAANTEPLPKPEPEPENSVWDWLKKYWWVILIVIAAAVVLWTILK
ncbi:caspase family protein [candidate division KSB1 bacterium]|nr:caspase family protein [candidate division KSB1 bacterium]